LNNLLGWMRTLLLVIMLCWSLPAGMGADAAPNLPVAHTIAGVPWHEQMNGLFCGDGALQILYDYWGPEIDQKQIANVARTSSSGTWTYDMVRAGHFSHLSSAQGRFFPHEVPEAGYVKRPLGYAAFSYSSSRFWLPELKALIASDIPVIVLTTFEPGGGGGHYKVAIGYDDSARTIYFSDPWGREQKKETGWTGITKWTYDEFAQGWNYSAEGEKSPHFGMIMLPWKVELKAKGKLGSGDVTTITAEISYPCPEPFNRSMFAAEDCRARIILPDGMRLLSNSMGVSLGSLKAGSKAYASWKAIVQRPVEGETIRVLAEGIIEGHVPEARWTGEKVYYPPYDYTDLIGGVGEFRL